MPRTFLLLLALAACGNRGPSTTVCELALERALVNQDRYLAEVLAHAPDSQHALLRAQAAGESANLERRFVSLCETDEDFKPECFESESSIECRAFLRDFLQRAARD
jgi:hypothetical protein